MFGVVCSANNASILIECTGSAKWGENNNEDDDDADADAGDDSSLMIMMMIMLKVFLHICIPDSS